MKKILIPLVVTIIAVLSFFLYSSRFYPLLNSDDALNILLTYYYKLPKDLYGWGLDRGGTLIPLISQLFHKGMGLSAVLSVSISNYLILTLGYIGFSSLLNRKYLKVLLALVIFFPPLRFIDITRFPLGVQYCLFGFSLFLIDKIRNNKYSTLYSNLLLVSAILTLSISLWVSDFAVVSTGVLLITLILFHLIKYHRIKIPTSTFLITLIGLILCFIFIFYAKTNAAKKTEEYLGFHNIESFVDSLRILKYELVQVLTFRSTDIAFGVYAWLIISTAFVLFISVITRNTLIKRDKLVWVAFFLFDFLIVLGVLIVSKWVYLNDMGRWYFVPTYISFSLLILLVLDKVNLQLPLGKITLILTTIAITVGSLSTLHYIKFVKPKSFRSKVSIKSELLTLGEIGLIGNFWNSYISSCPDPSRIKAITNDPNVRSQIMIDEVFSQPKIYLIKDMWLDVFPDTIQQFGYILERYGDSIHIGNCEINEYVKALRNEDISLQEFRIRDGVIRDNNSIQIPKSIPSIHNKYAIWGPYIQLGKGDYLLKYSVRATNINQNGPIAVIDIVTEHGTHEIAKKEVIQSDPSNNQSIDIEIQFECNERYTNVEFRLLHYGNADLVVENVRLIGIN